MIFKKRKETITGWHALEALNHPAVKRAIKQREERQEKQAAKDAKKRKRKSQEKMQAFNPGLIIDSIISYIVRNGPGTLVGGLALDLDLKMQGQEEALRLEHARRQGVMSYEDWRKYQVPVERAHYWQMRSKGVTMW